MTASSRFGACMFAGAVLSGALVGYEATKRHAQTAAAAAQGHVSVGAMKLSGFVALAVVIGLVLFVVATVIHARNRPQRQRRAPSAPPRQGGYGYRGGYR